MKKDRRAIKILIIEDNPGDVLLVEEFLLEQFDEAKLVHAATFREAESLLENTPEDFDVILLDLTLPDRDGEHLVDDIIQIAKGLPVVVLTGYSDLNFSVKSMAMGISDYLLKDDLSPALLYKSIIYSIERNVYSEKIRESEKNYRNLFELSPQPMYVFDLESFKFLDVNRATVMHYGYSKEEFLSMSIRDIRPEEEVPRMEKVVGEISDRDRVTDAGTFKHRKKNGDIIQVHITTTTVHYQDRPARIVIADDVTEKLKEEERLKLLESVITKTTEAVVILEAEKSRGTGRKILYVNDAFTKITGYTAEEVYGKPLHFLNGPKTDESALEKLRQSIRNWKNCEVEMINYRKDGSEFWVNTSMVPVADKKQGFSHWVAIGRDISDRKRYETELKDSLKEKNVLLAEIHHRVKNNLAVVSSMMQLQAFEEENKEVEVKLLDSIFRIRTMATIHELLYQSGSFSQLVFTDIVEQLVSSIDQVLGDDKKISFNIDSDEIELNINQAIPCSLIINEVVTNIYKHAVRDRETGVVKVDLKLDGNLILLTISDNGTGFPKGFDYRKSGTLGMNIIQILSTQLEGESGFESSKQGTTFHLEFEKKVHAGIGSAKIH